jgi:transcriptional regulator with XRE-family HTH domain
MTDAKLLKLVGKRVKELREERGMTQEEAARVSGFDYKYFQRIEYGQRNLSLISLAKLAKAFKVTIADIVSIEIA